MSFLFFNSYIDESFVLDLLSTNAKNTISGAYALVRLFTTYADPIVKLRRISDNATLDFYSDKFGTLGTGVNGTGTSVYDWIGTSSAAIVTWYDQSGNGNHATQATTTAQPALSNACIDFTNNSGLSRLALPNNTISSANNPYTIIVRHGRAFGTNTAGEPFVGSGTGGSSNQNLVVGKSNNVDRYEDYWWANDINAPGFIIGNYVTFLYDGVNGTTRQIYVNGVSQTITGGTTSVRNSTTTNNFIGYGDTTNNNYLNGDLNYVILFKSALVSSDRVIVESIKTPLQYPPIALSANTQVVSGQPYGNGTYNITASTNSGLQPWNAFDKVNGTGASGYWQSAFTYNAATGNYGGTVNFQNMGQLGEWIQIQIPNSAQLLSYSLSSRTDTNTQLPKTFYLAASNDGTNWVFIDNRSGLTWTNGQTRTFSPTSNIASYSYYTLITTSLNAQYQTVCIGELRLFCYT